jgi:hypothetical protein
MMKHVTRLALLNDQPFAEGEATTLKDQVNAIIDGRRAETIERVKKTVIYHTEMGGTQLLLDEIPGVQAVDMPFVVEWMKSEGFEISTPRLMGRPSISLCAPEK